jgi:hypothetical protein
LAVPRISCHSSNYDSDIICNWQWISLNNKSLPKSNMNHFNQSNRHRIIILCHFFLSWKIRQWIWIHLPQGKLSFDRFCWGRLWALKFQSNNALMHHYWINTKIYLWNNRILQTRSEVLSWWLCRKTLMPSSLVEIVFFSVFTSLPKIEIRWLFFFLFFTLSAWNLRPHDLNYEFLN